MKPRKVRGEECGDGLRSGAQYFSFKFLSGDSFNGIGQIGSQHMVDTDVRSARFCESKLYLATNVRNFILDEAMDQKGSGICDSKR
jgi:hypothetical protein